MTKEELATERNEVREILEGFSEELSQSNLDKLSRVFCIINGDEKRIAELEYQLTHRNCLDCSNHSSKLRMRNLDLEKENAELKEKNFFDLYKQNKEPEKEKEQNKDWMYYQRERNELGADYLSYQGYHPPKN